MTERSAVLIRRGSRGDRGRGWVSGAVVAVDQFQGDGFGFRRCEARAADGVARGAGPVDQAVDDGVVPGDRPR